MSSRRAKKLPTQRCSNVSRYEAKRPPTCGCMACRDEWDAVHLERAERAADARPTRDGRNSGGRDDLGEEMISEKLHPAASVPLARGARMRVFYDRLPEGDGFAISVVDFASRFCASGPWTKKHVLPPMVRSAIGELYPGLRRKVLRHLFEDVWARGGSGVVRIQ